MLNINNSLKARNLNTYLGSQRPTIMGIVLHDTAGSGTVGDAHYLANDPEHRGVSVDFVIMRDGEIYKLNPDITRYSTNHAGRHTSFKGQLNAKVNAHTVGIEMAHNVIPAKQFPEWPDLQVRSAADLCKDLCTKFSLIREDITTHYKIITDGSRSDPRNFPWEMFWQTFDNNSVNVGTFHEVKIGETLWGLAQKYHTTIEAIKALNHFNTPSTLITVGQRLLVRE